tara:strand:- start:1419 stop:1574 length:156 start_codon:yes stop_codon:yes gene_type:complete
MEVGQIIEKLNEALAEESWTIIEDLMQELEAESGFSDPFEDYDDGEEAIDF